LEANVYPQILGEQVTIQTLQAYYEVQQQIELLGWNILSFGFGGSE